MDKKTTFTIIVPLYLPYKKYIPECIVSIQKQTYSLFECILVVPLSQKEEFSNLNLKLDNRFMVLYSDSTSQSVNRNIGIKNASGNYIVFVDCDDMVDENYLSKSHLDIINDKPDIILFGYTRDVREFGNIVDNSKIVVASPQEIDLLFYSMYNGQKNITNTLVDSSCCKVYKRSIIKRNDILLMS